MAIVQNPVTGKSRNKFANAIFSTWNSLNVMRSKPLSVANPKTAKQRAQRLHTSLNAKFAKWMGSAMEIGYRTRPAGQSARGQGLKNNYPAISVNPSSGLPLVTFADLKASAGSISPTPIDLVSVVDGSNATAIEYFGYVKDPSQSNTDLAAVVVINETQDNSVTNIGTSDRSDGVVSFNFPTDFVTGDKVHVYLFLYSVSTKAVSDTTYFYKVVA